MTHQRLYIFYFVIFIYGLVANSLAVRINKLEVPKTATSNVPVTLDCEYVLDDNDDNVVIKWFFGNDHELVYQWILKQRPPIALGILKGRLDLDYEANANNGHSALRILKPTPELTGNYTCLISTITSEDQQTKELFVSGLVANSLAVRINKLEVPKTATSNIPVTLDCEYVLDDNDDNVVIKWFFGNNHELVYQWILKQRSPIALGVLKGRLDLNYEANANNGHSALRILKPTPELTGNYTCLISTMTSEDQQTKELFVSDPVSKSETETEHEV